MTMDIQSLVVLVLVPACFLYAVWVLMPAALRRRLAAWLLGFRWPGPIARLLGRQATGSAGCRCGGCDQAADAGSPAQKSVVSFQPRRKDVS
jgi:hypothetical protein